MADQRSARRRHRAAATLLAALATGAALAVIVFSSDGNGHQTSPPQRSDEPVASDGTVAPARARPRPIVRFTVGRGRRGAAIVRRAGVQGPQPVVVFLHGWGLTQRSAYRGWIRHLAALGSTVIVPRYQRDSEEDPRRVRSQALAGIRVALRRAPAKPGTLVVAGHSAGAALAADYAAVAGSLRLPRPVAVFSVYPGRRILGYPSGIPAADPSRIPSTARILALAGARDTVVGEEPARSLVASATQVPPSRRRLVRVTVPSVADHLAPTRDDTAARRAFWRRLDRLIAAARAS